MTKKKSKKQMTNFSIYSLFFFLKIQQTSNRKELSQPDKDKEGTVNTGNNVDQSQNNYSA